MTKQRKVRILSAALAVAVIGFPLVHKSARRGPGDTQARTEFATGPESAIYDMLNAARAGNVRAYLASYSGPQQARLTRIAAESPERDFARSLASSDAGVKGVALSTVQATEGSATVRVEYVYADHNETQVMHLEKSPAGWKIDRTDRDERIEAPIPYGTVVR